jgi:hypothetical protein
VAVAKLAIAFGLVVLTAGCAASPGVVPDTPKHRYVLKRWPGNAVTLEVVDARPKRDDESTRLVRFTTAVLVDALSSAEAGPGPARRLRVEITTHEVVREGSLWNAYTRFRATLTEHDRTVATWKAAGEDRRFHWLPSNYDEKAASQEAFHRAMTDLIGKLGSDVPALQ